MVKTLKLFIPFAIIILLIINNKITSLEDCNTFVNSLLSKNTANTLETSDQRINVLQMLATFLCEETQIVPKIHGIIIFYHNFHEIWTRQILKEFFQ
jgi:hypothetical protein